MASWMLGVNTSYNNWLLDLLKSVRTSIQIAFCVVMFLLYLSACATYQVNLPIPQGGVLCSPKIKTLFCSFLGSFRFFHMKIFY